jgi:integrase
MKKSSAWPKMKPVIKNGKPMILVDARIGGAGERKFFPTKAEAEGWAQVCRVRRKNEGKTSMADERLSAYGWTVARAIQFALDHLERKAASVPLADAVAALLQFKADRVGATRLNDIRNRLARFAARFSGRTIAAITPEDINAFLQEIPHPATRNDYRKEIVMLWHFAKSKKWVSEELDKHLVQRATEPDKARVILSVGEAIKLMAASVDDDTRALNALVLFGGCRREEVEKMDWQNINFTSGHIEIAAEVSKVNTERFAPITDNLRAWLMPIAKHAGPIVSRNLTRPLREVWKNAGLYPWPQDAHRHSFISYRRRIIGDAQCALDAGTSETIIKRHYKRPVTKEDAAAYFAILPAKAANVVAMPRRAA